MLVGLLQCATVILMSPTVNNISLTESPHFGDLILAALAIGAGYSIASNRFQRLVRAALNFLKLRTRVQPISHNEVEPASDAFSAGAYDTMMEDIVHDMNGPLSALKASAYLIDHLIRQQNEANPQTTSNLREQAARISSSVTRLQELFESLADIRRIERPPTLKPRELSEMVNEVAAPLMSLATQKGLAFRLDITPGSNCVDVDEYQFTRAVQNLIANAIRYTPSGGMLTIRVARKAGQAILEVQDTGIGIEPADLPRIFDRYFRSEAALRLNSNGTGLGLSIVQTIVKAHRGKVEVESEPGRGSLFRITLPPSRAIARK